jgi:hypothetical protein
MHAIGIAALITLAASVASGASLHTQDEGLGPRSAAEAWHVRGLEPHIQALIARGFSGSPTFRRLVEELNASDVMVHVRHHRMRDGFRGYLVHDVLESNGIRYLQIAVDARGPATRLIPLIAHELQHALEVARVPSVGRSLAIADHFEKIADHPCRAKCFETAAAVSVQEDVSRELR